jgi:hypothetical protein
MTKKSLILGVVALCALPAAGQAQTTTLLRETFDEARLFPMLGATDVGAFETIDNAAGVMTNVDLIGGHLFGHLCASPATLNCVDLNGTAGRGPPGSDPQGILRSKTSFALKPGFVYTLRFVLNGDPAAVFDTSTTVTFAGKASTFNLPPDHRGTSTIEIKPTEPTTTFITFASNQSGNIGSILDDVFLTSSPISAVPEPATLGLLVLGLLGGAGAGFARRKRSN